MTPKLSVIICSFNGANGVERCLRALHHQTISTELEVIVVDDGSTDSTSYVAQSAGARVIRHSVNEGASAARNSGISVATAALVAFLDDDCEPLPDWAEALISSYESVDLVVGGPLLVARGSGVLKDYLRRNNPLRPQELELARSNKLAYRFLLYLKRQWCPSERDDRREVVSLPTANMSVRREPLLAVGGFDARIRFGGEDDDLCRRLKGAYPDMRVVFEPRAQVLHHFKTSIRDMMRRSRAYGRASALMYRKWPDVGPTFFPYPLIWLVLLAASAHFPMIFPVAVVLPQFLYPNGLRVALRGHMSGLADPYLQLVRETCDDVGFVEGLWRFRDFDQAKAEIAQAVKRAS